MQVNVSQLLTQDYKTPTAAAVIPLSVNMTIDGIGGIVKGHMFKIEPDRLPKAYEKSNIGFITFGEEQMITVGGDWTTKLEGKMTILPDTANKAAIAKGTIEDFTSLDEFIDQAILESDIKVWASLGANSGEIQEEILVKGGVINSDTDILILESVLNYAPDNTELGEIHWELFKIKENNGGRSFFQGDLSQLSQTSKNWLIINSQTRDFPSIASQYDLISSGFGGRIDTLFSLIYSAMGPKFPSLL